MLTELRRRLEEIITCEEESDWDRARMLCSMTLKEFNDEGTANLANEAVYRFLDDFDIREQDAKYGIEQRSRVRRLL